MTKTKQENPTTGATSKKKEPSATRSITQLAELLDLPSWDKIDEINADYFMEEGFAAREAFLADNPDATEDEQDEATSTAERAASDEIYGKWHHAVLQTAEWLFEKHGLEIKVPSPAKQAFPHPFDFTIVPKVSWTDACEKIRETVNGVGYFWFSTLKEFLDSGPYTARRACLAHLGYLRRYPEVYGDSSARAKYEGAWR